jgi:hypothetical protein
VKSHETSDTLLWAGGKQLTFFRRFPGYVWSTSADEAWEPKKMMLVVASFKFLVRTSQRTPIIVAIIYSSVSQTMVRGPQVNKLKIIQILIALNY